MLSAAWRSAGGAARYRATVEAVMLATISALNCAADPSNLLPTPFGDGVAAFVEFDVIDEGLDRFTR